MGLAEMRSLAAVTLVFLALIAAAEFWRRHGGSPERTRKLVHIAGGLICLSFPWLFQSPIPVFILAVSMFAIFLGTKKAGFLDSLHGVTRQTRGTEVYPLAIFFVFLLSAGEAWRYVSALCVLATADGFAALIGTRYGAHHYQVEKNQKSLEGSLGFLVIAFLAVYLPVEWMTDFSFFMSVLSALYVAVLVTGFEAISLNGKDNLFIPLGVCIILGKISTKPITEITFQLGSLCAIILLVGILAYRSRTFNTGGTIGIVLFVYGSWSLGSVAWGVEVFVGFLVYLAAMKRWPLPAGDAFRIRIVTRVLAVPFAVLLVGNLLRRENDFFPVFCTAIGVVTAIILVNHGKIYFHHRHQPLPMFIITVAGLSAACLVLISALLTHGVSPDLTALSIAGLILTGSYMHAWLERDPISYSADSLWTYRQILIFSGGVVLSAGVQLMGAV